MVDLHCWVSFRCTEKWFLYLSISPLFQILFHYSLLHIFEYSTVCYTVDLCWLSILAVCVSHSLVSDSVHGSLQAKTLEWVAIPFSRGSSWLRDWTWVSCITGRSFTIWATQCLTLNLSSSYLTDLKMIITRIVGGLGKCLEQSNRVENLRRYFLSCNAYVTGIRHQSEYLEVLMTWARLLRVL